MKVSLEIGLSKILIFYLDFNKNIIMRIICDWIELKLISIFDRLFLYEMLKIENTREDGRKKEKKKNRLIVTQIVSKL